VTKRIRCYVQLVERFILSNTADESWNDSSASQIRQIAQTFVQSIRRGWPK